MNKDYIKIILVPFVIICLMILKPISAHIFGTEVLLKCTNEHDSYWDGRIYPEFKIEHSDSYKDKLDSKIYDFYNKSVAKIKNESISTYEIGSKTAYAILEEKNGYHDIKYITFDKPKNEVYLECSISIQSYYPSEYDNRYIYVDYKYDSEEEMYAICIDFYLLTTLDFELNDLVVKGNEAYLPIIVNKNYIIKK